MRNSLYKVLFPEIEKATLVTEPLEHAPLGEDEVSGRTLFSLISAGTEINLYKGEYQRQGLAWGQLPFVPGYAAVFEVEAVGEGVDDIKPGDKVYCMGKHVSHQRHARRDVLPLPAGLDPELGPFARLANIGMSCLTTVEARPPARVVTTGLGLVGLAGAMVFHLSGFDVISVDPVADRRRLAEARGLPKVLDRIDLGITGKVPLVLDFSGHEQAILDGLDIIEQGGEVVVAGVPMTRKTEIYAQEVLNKLFRTFGRIRSGKEQQVAAHPTPFRQGSMFGNMNGVLNWMTEGRLDFSDLHTRVSPHDAQEAYQDVLHMRQQKLALMFDWGMV